MGQGQSTADDDASADAPLKTDYYDLLGVDRLATDEEIKKAYRRKALELHPDRNYGNVEHATRLFAQVQSAYEVLSDPQERAWYDSHKDVLLRGESGARDGSQDFSYNVRMTTTQEVLKLMLRFNGRLAYTDSPNGFYGGLRDFFQKLANEEDIACQWEGEPPMEYPVFGHMEDDYDDVVRPFYAAWNGFATRKSYAWKDKYKLSDAPDRRIRRLMEKENKKIRDEAIREYNDAVRSLVAFVRKRDPRFQENQKSEAERQKTLRDAAAAQAARSRAARQARMQELDQMSVPEWSQSHRRDEHEGGFSSESEKEEHEYECVVCDKIFKSEAQLDAHEKSKKHLKLLKQLKRNMRDQDDSTRGEEAQADDVAGDTSEADEQPMDGVDPNTERLQNSANTGVGSVHDLSPLHSPPEESPPSEPSDDDYAPRSEIEDRLSGDTVQGLSSNLSNAILEDTPATSETDLSSQPKMGKAKQKRAKKAAQQASGGSVSGEGEFRCVVCHSGFPSKTRLFNHIKEKGHAAPVSQVNTSATKGGKAKKR